MASTARKKEKRERERTLRKRSTEDERAWVLTIKFEIFFMGWVLEGVKEWRY